MKFLEHRIADRRILRLIQKWLRAGVIEDGEWSKTEVGTPQGAVASPLLANVYLHYVFDLWVQQWRTTSRHGRRDRRALRRRFRRRDSSIAHDAERFLRDLRERFAKFGLELHPDKTRLIEFGRYAAGTGESAGRGQAGDVRLPGLHAHLWEDEERAVLVQAQDHLEADAGQACRGQRRTASDADISPSRNKGNGWRSVVRGHFAYYAVPGNTDAVAAFRNQVTRHWFKALRRRSQRTA